MTFRIPVLIVLALVLTFTSGGGLVLAAEDVATAAGANRFKAEQGLM